MELDYDSLYMLSFFGKARARVHCNTHVLYATATKVWRQNHDTQLANHCAQVWLPNYMVEEQ